MSLRVKVGGAFSAVAVFVAAILLAGGASTTLRVATTGADTGNCLSAPCLTVAYAYTQASPGDTIELAAGVYGAETIAYRSGMSASRVTIRPATAAVVSLTDVEIKASYLTISGGITFRTLNFGDATGAQRITDITLDGFSVDHQDSSVVSRNAVQAYATDNVVLRDGSIGNTMAGASVGQESNLLQFSGQPTLYNTNWTVDGIRFYANDSPAGSAAHNECIYAVHVPTLTIRNSRFESCTYYGIFFTDFLNAAPGLSNVTVENNIFHTPRSTTGADTGFSIDIHDQVSPDNFKFRYNTIENAITLGFAGTLTNGFEVRGNIIALGVYTRYDGSFACKPGVTFSYNVIPNSCGTGTTTATEAAIRAGWANPSSTWGVADDFNLLAASPAVGAGDLSAFPVLDFAGLTRGTPPDAGAYEFVAAGDSTAPTQPGTLTATGQAGQVALAWGASTDSVGVTGYRVHRSTSSGFTPNDANLLGTALGLIYNDATATPGTTYYYRVSARDAADNRSVASNEASGVASAVSSNTANIWVDSDGGTCTRQGVQAVYSSASACASFDAALDAMTAGDTARVKAATYGAQTMDGNKTSETRFIAENGTHAGQLVINANFVTIENLINDGNTTVGANNVTVRDYSLHGLEPDVFIGQVTGFLWDGGEFGFAGWNPTDRDFCNGSSEPINVNGSIGPVLDGVTFWGIDTVTNAACNHAEYIRVQQDSALGWNGSGLTIRNSWWEPGDGSNTATIFVTSAQAGATYSGLTVENTFFGSNAASSGVLQVHGNVGTCSSFTFAYNTFVAYPGAWTCTWTGTWVGNLGPYASSSPCAGTHTRNRWQYSIAGSCGTDQWTIGTAFGVGSLGFDTATGALNAGSVAIDSGETPSASDYCTGALGSADRLGTVRPQGAVCDAGQDER